MENMIYNLFWLFRKHDLTKNGAKTEQSLSLSGRSEVPPAIYLFIRNMAL